MPPPMHRVARPVLAVRRLHLMQQGDQDAAAGSAYRVAQSDSAAVDIHLVAYRSPDPAPQPGTARQRPRWPRSGPYPSMVRPAPGHDLLGGGNRADAHDGGIHAAQSAGNPGSHGLNAQLLGLLFAHYHDGGSAVIDTGSVAGGDDAVLLEGGLQARPGSPAVVPGRGPSSVSNDHRAPSCP